jgi:hypothetical protein
MFEWLTERARGVAAQRAAARVRSGVSGPARLRR